MNHYTFDDMPGFVAKAASYVAHRYRPYGVESDDVSQEIYAWLYGKGRKRVERWLETEDDKAQQTTRIYLSMLAVGRVYAEKEKAARAGYKAEDVWWYTPASLEALIPLALDASFTQSNGQLGELTATVLDIRKAVQECGLWAFFADSTDEHPDYRSNILVVLDKLGGERPVIGRRRVMTNAHAQAVVSEVAG